MKNIPIVVGLASIAVAQCGLGICTIVLSARGGGEIRPALQRNRSHSEHRRAPQFCLCSLSAVTYTPRYVPDMRIGTTIETHENRKCGPIPLLWCQNPRDSGSLTDKFTSDFLVFSLVILFARKSRVPGLKFPSLLDTVAEDATWYFLVIFTTHLLLVITLSFGRVSLIMSFPDCVK